MVTQRRQYTKSQLEDATARVINGEKGTAISKQCAISYSTLMKYVALVKSKQEIVIHRRGPKPVLSEPAELCIYEWIVGMQSMGCPVEPDDILTKANAVAATLNRARVGAGWYRRFLSRHPQLAVRTAQVISRARNEASLIGVMTLCWTMAKVVIENGLDVQRVFNVDETAFLTRNKSRRVVAVKGSKNVWSKSATANFHLSIVACGSAAGVVIPPMFILPGERVSCNVLDACEVVDATVTTTNTGFINGFIFKRWLRWFNGHIPDSIQRPVVLVMDGYRCHYSEDLVTVAHELGILLVCLPANATHLLQPLDVSVFSSFKKHVKKEVKSLMISNGLPTISKADAIKIGSIAWNNCNFSANIASGFQSTGLFPVNRVRMAKRVNAFKCNGVRAGVTIAQWLRDEATIKQDILTLPPVPQTRKKRKTFDVDGRLLTKEMLQVDQPTKKKRKNAKKQKASNQQDCTLEVNVPVLPANVPTEFVMMEAIV